MDRERSDTMMRGRRPVMPAVLAAVVLTVTGCAGSSSSGTSDDGQLQSATAEAADTTEAGDRESTGNGDSSDAADVDALTGIPLDPVVEAAVLNEYRRVLALEEAARLGDAEARAEFDAAVSAEVQQVLDERLEFETIYADSFTDNQTMVTNVVEVTGRSDGSALVRDCVTIVNDGLVQAAEEGSGLGMRYETREAIVAPEADGWALVGLDTVEDGVPGEEGDLGCAPPDQVDRVADFMARFFGLNLEFMRDPEKVIDDDFEAYFGEDELLAQFAASYGAERNTFTTSPEEFRFEVLGLDLARSWWYEQAHVYVVELCAYLPEGRVYERVGTGETKIDTPFVPGTVYQTGFLVRSTPDGSGGWVDELIGSGGLEVPSDCWDEGTA